MLVTDTFISNDGGEKYITIGNFNDDADSDTLYHFSGDTSAIYAYYFIDDVSVIAIDTTIGVEENEQMRFEVYPNPAKESIVIEAEFREQTTIKLFDVMGREVLAASLTATKTTLDVSGFAGGVYTAVLLRDGVAVGRRKILVE